jgi:class 3 adenylate cyclase
MRPGEIATELAETGAAKPVRHESATVLFTDFSGFTQAASTMPADRMVAELSEVFSAFDDICDEEGVEKIKTIGDAYMAAAGLPKPSADHAQRCVRAGLRMVAFVEQRNADSAFKWRLRVGIHSGPVIAGVVGKRKYAFDIWGDTVNIAARMESAGEAGRVNVSAYTYDLIRKDFACEYRGRVDAKGKGEVDMYFVEGAKS